MYGFHGSYRRIDLARGTAEDVALSPAVLRRYLGGVGLGCRLLLHETRGAYDALEPSAPLLFSFSPLAGTALNTSAKAAVLSKSPLTQRLNDAMISSTFALAGKRSGVDALVLRGACADWSTLFVEPGGVTLRPTPELCGLSAGETARHIAAEHGAGWSVAAIGLAGEQGVPFATLSHDGRHAGRGGTGAVMGAKRLKAIAVRGDMATRVADPARFEDIRRRLQERTQGQATDKYRSTGTLGNLLVFNRLGVLPTNNFRAGSDARAEQLSAEHLYSSRVVQRASCADCSIGCEKRVTTADGATVRLEYENFFALGPLLGLWDADVVIEASRRCDAYGLDTISTGGTLAFALECMQRGLLVLPGLRLPAPGSEGAFVLEAIERIARREGYGAQLARGSRALAREIGPAAMAIAPQVKGLEFPGYHPARLQTLGLGLAVGTRGADHNKSGAYDLDLSGRVDPGALDTGRIAAMVLLEDQAAIMDSVALCKFIRQAFDDLFAQGAEILSALTGDPYSGDDLHAAARDIHHLKKLFNQRQGWGAEEDVLPERFMRTEGGQEGIDPQQFRAARAAYYHERGWDEQGRLMHIPALL